MMLQGWRWYGPDDPVSLDDIRQAGATDVVTALHQIPIGEVWTRAAVEQRKEIIENGPAGRSPLIWSVVESIPIPDDVKRLGGQAVHSIEAWIESLKRLPQRASRSSATISCRSSTGAAPISNGSCRTAPARCVSTRTASPRSICTSSNGPAPSPTIRRPRRRGRKQVFEAMSQADIDYMVMVVASALPGSTTEPMSIPQFRDRLEQYQGITAQVLRQHLIEFLARVAPVAEEVGVTLTLHPDDPPRSLFGLPRIASSAEDYSALFDAVPSKANGICLCTGSLGVRAENDLPAMARRSRRALPLRICVQPGGTRTDCPSSNPIISTATST